MCYYFWVFGNRRTNRIFNGYQAALQHHWNVIADPVFKIELDKNCLGGNSTGALMTGPAIQCSGNYVQSLWYKYQSSFNGKLKIETNSKEGGGISSPLLKQGVSMPRL